MHPGLLEKLHTEHDGFASDKWSIYLAEYDRLLTHMRQAPVTLVEIGVQNGGSLQVWEKYFPNAQRILGCDINPDCARLSYASDKIALVIGDITRMETLERIFAMAPSFDIVIDDGSHTSGDIIQTFCSLFPRLERGGVFIAEDLHCSYWQSHDGGLFHPRSSMAFFKALADVLNFEHWGIAYRREELLQPFGITAELSEAVLAEIHSVEFVNSMCIVTRRSPEENCLGRRRIAGTEERVSPVHYVQGTLSQTAPQHDNRFARRENAASIALGDGPAGRSALEAKIYWQAKRDGLAGSYEEAHSVAATYPLNGQVQRLVMAFPDSVATPCALRLDIANAPAAILLHELRLVDAAGNPLWQWDGCRDAFVHAAGVAFFREDDGAPYTLFTLDGDPRFELNLPEATLAAIAPGCALLLEVTPHVLTERLGAALARLDATVVPAAPAGFSLAADLAEVATLLRSRLDRKEQQIATLQERLRTLETGQRQAHEQLLRAESQLELLKELLLDGASVEPL